MGKTNGQFVLNFFPFCNDILLRYALSLGLNAFEFGPASTKNFTLYMVHRKMNKQSHCFSCIMFAKCCLRSAVEWISLTENRPACRFRRTRISNKATSSNHLLCKCQQVNCFRIVSKIQHLAKSVLNILFL